MANNNPTFGALLHSLNDDLLKNKIRSIEKLNKKIVNIKNGIRFNETCIKEGLHPKFTNMYIYIYSLSIFVSTYYVERRQLNIALVCIQHINIFIYEVNSLY